MDQFTRDNTETDSGYTWPQIGCMVNALVEIQIGFSSTHPRAVEWEVQALKQIEDFYGYDVYKFVETRLNKMYAEDETGENMNEEIPEIIEQAIPMCAEYECRMALL